MITGVIREVPVEQPDHPFRPEALGETREAAQVRHHDGHGPDLPAEIEGVLVPEALLGQLRADVAAQHVPDEVAIAQPLHHLGHGPRQGPDLVAAPRGTIVTSSSPLRIRRAIWASSRSGRAIHPARALPPPTARASASTPSTMARRPSAFACSV
jgi:hypothetical protein